MNKKKFTSKVFYEEQSKTYIDIDDNLLILKDGKTILRTSEQAGYNHIYTLNFDGTSKQVTQGKWDVIQFLGIDEDNGTIYYSAATQGPINEGIYKIGIDGSGNQAISSETGSNGATFSNGMKYFNRAPIKTAMEGDFDTGNVRYKARERYSFGVSDYRGIFGVAGA